MMKRFIVLVRLPVGDHTFFVRAEDLRFALLAAAKQLDKRGFKVADVLNILVSEEK